jgi:hypothetical protein
MSEIPEDIHQKAREAVKGRYAKGHGVALVTEVARALLAERERAARIAEDYPTEWEPDAHEIAAAIRSQP